MPLSSPVDDFSTLFELLPIGAYRSAPDGLILRANPALVRMNNATSEANLLAVANGGTSDWYVDPLRRAEFRRILAERGDVTGFISEIELYVTRERRWINENAHAVFDDSGRVLFYEGTIEDITEKRALEQGLALSERRFRALTAKSQSATIVCDAGGKISFASGAVEMLLGIDAESVVGTNLFDSMHPDDQVEHRSEFARVAAHNNSGNESVARHRHTDGSWRYLASFASDARDDPAVRGMIVYWRDVTDAHIARMRLRSLSETDSLTGQFSRAMFERTAAEVLERAHQKRHRVALFFVDLDNFKLANDSYGHWFGDQILIATGRRLRALVGDGDIVGRLGGDEFAVLAQFSEDEMNTLEDRAASIVQELAKPIRVDATQFEVTVSVGVACYPTDAASYSELLRFADQAMFAAKAASRNTYRVFTAALEKRVRERVSMISDLRRAVANREFVVYYQPQVDMANAQLVGVEALVRWQHPVRGVLAPAEFIEVAEDQGLINAIGLQVIELAIPQIARWRAEHTCDLRLAINVSAQQFRDDTFVRRLRILLQRYELCANAVEVEVTESILLAANRDGRNVIEELRNIGVRVVLDDLGVGYSSMAYLRQFPVDGVKLDRGFVQGLPNNAVDAAIVRSIISLTRELGLTLVAEGVEDHAQRTYLVGEHCRVGQGYLFSIPVAVGEFERAGWLWHVVPHPID